MTNAFRNRSFRILTASMLLCILLISGCVQARLQDEFSITWQDQISIPPAAIPLGSITVPYDYELDLSETFTKLGGPRDLSGEVKLRSILFTIHYPEPEMLHSVDIVLMSEGDPSLPVLPIMHYEQGTFTPNPLVIEAEVTTNLLPYLMAGKLKFHTEASVSPSQMGGGSLQIQAEAKFSMDVTIQKSL